MPSDTDPRADTVAASSDPTVEPTLTPQEAGDTRASGPGPGGGAVGSMIGGRYRLQSALGRGGMGEVLCAVDKQIGREVAVKRMRGAAGAEAVARFEREARIQGRLDHPAIVPVHELAYDDAGQPYFVMKRLTGVTLAAYLADRSDEGQARCSRNRMLRAFVDVCLAVAFAHRRGVVHRDLKPANIVLGDFGEVYVLDWGVARVLDEADDAGAGPGATGDLAGGSTQVGTVLGTPGYIAPEQLRGEAVDGRADIYSLGCVLFEILCRQPLVPRGQELSAPLDELDARPSRHATDELEPELDDLCVAATRVDPADRIASARDLGDAVQRYLEGDRDLELRTERAQAHLAAARAALARGDRATERAEAMREAGRALALCSKTGTEAAELIARLMLEPPAAVPDEVEAALAARETESVRNQVRLVLYGMIGFLLCLPGLAWIGVRDVAYPFAALGLVILNMLVLWRITLMPPGVTDRRLMWASVVANAALIAVMSAITTPYLLTPALTIITAIVLALYQSTRTVPIAFIFSVAALGPLALERAGVLPPMASSAPDGALIVTSPAIELPMPQFQILFALTLIAMLGVCSVLARGFGAEQTRAFRKLELQAWHLRQLAHVDRAS